MAEDGCITDFRAKNLECNNLLIKDGTFKTTGDGDIKEINDYMDLDFGLLTTSRPPQNKTGIYIPYYQYPDWTSGSDFLNDFNGLMNILDRNKDVPVLTIINPNSGPGTSYDANYGRFIKRLNNHNITIVGYLATTFGNKTVANVKIELLRWFEFYPQIKGIFFDEVPTFTSSNKDTHIAYFNELYRMVKSESRRVLKRFLTVTINSGTENEFLYPLSVYEHSGDITNVCFDQIVDHEKITFPDIYTIENDTDINSLRFFNRGARIAIIHSQSTYNEELVKKTMKYWSWLFITKDVMNNPFDDISLAYIEEMCKTFSDNSKFDDKLDKVGNISIGEDNSDLLVINSTINIPGGTTGQSLVKGSDGNITYSTVSGGGGGGGSSLTIKNAGTSLTNDATSIDFTGAGVTASGTSDGNKTVNIPGYSLTLQNAGSTLSTDATIINFTGAGVTASGGSDTKKIVIPGVPFAVNDTSISPNDVGNNRIQVNFTSFNNNGNSPYADAIHFNTWSDNTGGNQNLLMLNKTSIGLRIYQGTFGSSSAYSSYKDVVLADSNGKIGIGIDSPTSSLHIQSNTGDKFDAFRISNSTANDLDFTIQKVNRKHGFNYNSCVIGHGLEIDSTHSDNGGSDGKFNLNTDGFSVAGSAIVSQNGSLSFFTHNASSSSDIQILGSAMGNMTMLYNGNVGIGNTSPSTKLHVNGNITCTTLVGNCSGTSTSVNLTEDTSSNTSFVIPFTDGTSGSRALKGHSSFNYNPSTGLLTVPNLNASISVNTVSMVDNRQISPSELAGGKVQFNFTTFNNDNNSPFADAIHLNTYTDSSGGLQNLITLNKSSGIAMRVYQGTFGSSSLYSTYKDVVMSDSNGNVNITSRSATGTTDQRETIYKVRLPFTSGLKEECSGSIGFKDFVNNGTSSKPSFDLKLSTLSYTNTVLTAVSHSSNDFKIGINTTSPEYLLDIGGDTGSTNNTIRMVQADGGTAIRIGAGGGSNDVTLIRVDGDSTNQRYRGETDSGEYGFSIKYMGSRSGNNNSLSIFSDDEGQNNQIEAVTILQDGKFGINVVAPTTTLDVNGTVTCTGFNNTSDDRIKYNEMNINTSSALNVINQLIPQKYEKITEAPQGLESIWIPTDEEWVNQKDEVITRSYTDEDGNETTTTEPKWKWKNEIGLIAQDVKNISELSYCVIGNEVDSNGNQTPLKLNYNDIFSYHIAATKELTTQLNTANQKIATLENEIAAIKQHLGI
jgi:hypothetical protein